LSFRDYFSRQAEQYARFRPRYPRALFEYLAGLPAESRRAWDCGTGGGQAAVALAEDFDLVVATDPSVRQIANAEPHARVGYVVSSAEQCPLAADTVDLITVAQALHWFELDRFYDEARRVGRRSGAVAVWGYELAVISPEVDRVVRHLYGEILGPYWPPQRRLIEARYATVPFPFRQFAAPEFVMTARWNLHDLMGYLGTWSSVQKYIERHAANPLSQVQSELAAAWGSPEAVRQITWPLLLRVGRFESFARGL
jgi:ubiquinone/menaquinone biosynthesis C-methylase UbiE